MTPHVCPRCSGERVVETGDVFAFGCNQYVPCIRQCPTCTGTGVVWGASADTLTVNGSVPVQPVTRVRT